MAGYQRGDVKRRAVDARASTPTASASALWCFIGPLVVIILWIAHGPGMLHRWVGCAMSGKEKGADSG
eukprot:12932967-Prorocentrum_lima.AAC.1